ncbi:MAG: ELM1/GtrOC1 family putative glycosyltransferase, partial [Halieaceae bacterium]
MPVIWMIDAYRAGERAQVRALVDTLAETLGWEVEIIKLQYRPGVFLPQLLRQTSLRGISSDSAARLQAPWPELIVSCGLRNEPVCRWIRQQSGAYSRYLHLGRPWAPLDSFDLIVTTPQYRFPDRANVVNNTLTLHGITAQRLAQARQRWEAEFAALPGPHIAVIVGGDSGPFTFGPRAARRLAREASAMARQSGASLLISTSSRSSAAAMAALQAELDVPNYFYRWQPDDPANPYLGMLASADQLIVTGDSIAMLSEACATGKPVHIFDLGGMREDHQVAVDFRLGALLYGW